MVLILSYPRTKIFSQPHFCCRVRVLTHQPFSFNFKVKRMFLRSNRFEIQIKSTSLCLNLTTFINNGTRDFVRFKQACKKGEVFFEADLSLSRVRLFNISNEVSCLKNIALILFLNICISMQ